MSTITRCDRCGKEVKPRNIFRRILRGDERIKHDVTLSQELEFFCHKSRKYDLCADCYYELLEWLNGDQTWEVEKEE